MKLFIRFDSSRQIIQECVDIQFQRLMFKKLRAPKIQKVMIFTKVVLSENPNIQLKINIVYFDILNSKNVHFFGFLVLALGSGSGQKPIV